MIWEIVHKNVGRIIFVLAYANIVLGAILIDNPNYVIFAYAITGFFVVVGGVAMIRTLMVKNDKKRG